jgi:hypothetical protein
MSIDSRTSSILPPTPKKTVAIPPPDHPQRAAGWGYVWGLQRQLSKQTHPLHNFPLLRITDTCGVEPVRQLIGRPR